MLKSLYTDLDDADYNSSSSDDDGQCDVAGLSIPDGDNVSISCVVVVCNFKTIYY